MFMLKIAKIFLIYIIFHIDKIMTFFCCLTEKKKLIILKIKFYNIVFFVFFLRNNKYSAIISVRKMVQISIKKIL